MGRKCNALDWIKWSWIQDIKRARGGEVPALNPNNVMLGGLRQKLWGLDSGQ